MIRSRIPRHGLLTEVIQPFAVGRSNAIPICRRGNRLFLALHWYAFLLIWSSSLAVASFFADRWTVDSSS